MGLWLWSWNKTTVFTVEALDRQDQKKRVSRNVLTMSIVEVLCTDRSDNKEYYLKNLKRLRKAVRRKRPQFWSSGDFSITTSSNIVQQFLSKQYLITSTASVQSRRSPLWLACFQNSKGSDSMIIRWLKNATVYSRPTQKWVPGLFRKVETSLESCYSIKWGLLWRMPSALWWRITPDTFRTDLVC